MSKMQSNPAVKILTNTYIYHFNILLKYSVCWHITQARNTIRVSYVKYKYIP